MRNWLATFFMALIMAACQATVPLPTEGQIVEDGGRLIVGEELRGFFLDKTHYGNVLATGKTWYEYFAPDGRLVIREDGRPDPGTWQVTDSEFCFTYVRARGDRTFCFRSYERDGLIYGVRAGDDRDGEATTTIERIVDGNPEGLELQP